MLIWDQHLKKLLIKAQNWIYETLKIIYSKIKELVEQGIEKGCVIMMMLYNYFKKAILYFSDKISSLINKIFDFVQRIYEKMKSSSSDFYNNLKNKLIALWIENKPKLINLINKLVEFGNYVFINIIKKYFLLFLEKTKMACGNVFKFVKKKVIDFCSDGKLYFFESKEYLAKIIIPIFEKLKVGLTYIFNKTKYLLEYAYNKTIEISFAVFQILKQKVEKLYDYSVVKINQGITYLSKKLSESYEILKIVTKFVINTIAEFGLFGERIMRKIFNYLAESFSKNYSKAFEILHKIYGKIIEYGKILVSWIEGILNKFKNKLNDLAFEIYQLGNKIISKILEIIPKILNHWKIIYNWICEKADLIWKKIIHPIIEFIVDNWWEFLTICYKILRYCFEKIVYFFVFCYEISKQLLFWGIGILNKAKISLSSFINANYDKLISFWNQWLFPILKRTLEFLKEFLKSLMILTKNSFMKLVEILKFLNLKTKIFIFFLFKRVSLIYNWMKGVLQIIKDLIQFYWKIFVENFNKVKKVIVENVKALWKILSDNVKLFFFKLKVFCLESLKPKLIAFKNIIIENAENFKNYILDKKERFKAWFIPRFNEFKAKIKEIYLYLCLNFRLLQAALSAKMKLFWVQFKETALKVKESTRIFLIAVKVELLKIKTKIINDVKEFLIKMKNSIKEKIIAMKEDLKRFFGVFMVKLQIFRENGRKRREKIREYMNKRKEELREFFMKLKKSFIDFKEDMKKKMIIIREDLKVRKNKFAEPMIAFKNQMSATFQQMRKDVALMMQDMKTRIRMMSPLRKKEKNN